MADFPYVLTAPSLKRFFGHIQSAGVPDNVTLKYLEKVGFKSKNDRYIIGVLKYLHFLDSSGVPTNLWQAYRSKTKAPAVLASSIRNAYTDLFKTFPDAHRKDNEALRNYFSAHTRVAERTLGAIVMTFKALCEFADFEAEASKAVIATEGGGKVVGGVADVSLPRVSRAEPLVPPININIQLQLPATNDGSIYEKLFAALKKHLLS